ncbi:MAG: hypothetical protein H0W46_10935, partial [Acidimicrobiia bacterium]|nr:hypothetical protein [Acidimicrobiia bacterium]
MSSSAIAAPQGCVVSDPPNPGFLNPCTYEAGDDGTYAAYGRWWLRIERSGETIELSSDVGSSPVGTQGVVRSGDVVTARARGAGSSVFVGNPSPAAADAPYPPAPEHTTEDGTVASFDGASLAYSLHLPAGASAKAP